MDSSSRFSHSGTTNKKAEVPLNSAPINRSLQKMTQLKQQQAAATSKSRKFDTNRTRPIAIKTTRIGGEISKISSPTPKSSSISEYYLRNERNLNARSRKLTWSFITLVASITCLSPFLSLHLTQHIGLLLFESDLIQLRSSLFSVIICLIILVILYSIIYLLSGATNRSNIINFKGRGLLLQRLFKQLIGLLAIISAISYLSLALLVPPIRQVQRMPIATFDCNANLITIENCQQQFTTRGGEQSLLEAIGLLLFASDFGNGGSSSSSGNNRLIKKLNCFQYNDDELGALKVPTRFLLHHCGLVCRPQRQQLHQFSDDLNGDQAKEQQQQQHNWRSPEAEEESDKTREDRITATTSNSKLIPPYQHAMKNSIRDLEPDVEGTHLVYHNSSSNIDHLGQPFGELAPETSSSSSATARQVSLRVCFSSDFSSGSNYKQFCITNLANTAGHSAGQGHTLTVGQLNAMLRKFATPAAHLTRSPDLSIPVDMPATITTGSQEAEGNIVYGPPQLQMPSNDDRPRLKSSLIEDQTTHYVNPIVQFESHFKNWPHLSNRATSSFGDNGPDNDHENGGGWCKFRPIPPYIVNNKPFNDIQCSLEHEYTMTTGPSFPAGEAGGGSSNGKRMAEKIYLKKSATLDDSSQSGSSGSENESRSRDRCNIQCKVNILYQVQAGKGGRRGLRATATTSNQQADESNDQQHFYLPLKPCIMVSGDGNKTLTSNYYLMFRSLGDSTLIMAFILLDLYLLIEAIDSKRSQFESKKYRLIGILLVITLTPLTTSLLFDLISIYSPTASSQTSRMAPPKRDDSYLSKFLYDRLLPSLVDLIYSRPSKSSHNSQLNNNNNRRNKQSDDGQNVRQQNNTNATANSTNLSANLYFSDHKTLDPTAAAAFNFDTNFALPFFIYSMLMFTLAINSWTLPLVTSTAPLIRTSSAEELGMSKVGGSGSSINNLRGSVEKRKQTDGQESNQKLNNKQEASNRRSLIEKKRQTRKQVTKLISFILLTIFMGFQFNLSQFTQLQLLIETFGSPTIQAGSGDFTATWFTLGTHSTASLFILTLVLIFADETSTFFSNSFPLFNLTTSEASSSSGNYEDDNKELASNGHEKAKQTRRQANFLKYISWAQIIYSLRYFALLSLNPSSRYKWVVVFLFQVAEIFNFPIVWFALTSRLHELIAEHPAYMKYYSDENPASTTMAFNCHLVGQSTLAWIYSALTRYLALFAHSLYVSLHLHSDNVDWFINSFYQKKAGTDGYSSPKVNSNNTNSETKFNDSEQPDVGGASLFSPLPGERQTYLHASRLFLKYNSILCLMVGSYLLLNRLYINYQVWLIKRRQSSAISRVVEADRKETNLMEDTSSSQQIDERLSLDLMRIHQSNNSTRTIYPKPDKVGRVKGSRKNCDKDNHQINDRDSDELGDWTRNPRAKILFHYNLGHKDSSDESISGSATKLESTTTTTGSMSPTEVQVVEEILPTMNHDQIELRIPIALAEEEEDDELEDDDVDQQETLSMAGREKLFRANDDDIVKEETSLQRPETTKVLERVVKRRNKKVRIFEDDGAIYSRPNQDTSNGDEHQQQLHQKHYQHELVNSGSIYARPNSNGMRQSKVTDNSIAQQHQQSAANLMETHYKNNRKRTITFAPTATLIGHDGGTSGRQLDMRGNISSPQYASPEPSIDSDNNQEEDS